MKQTPTIRSPIVISSPTASRGRSLLSPVRLYSYLIPKLFGSSFAVGTPGRRPVETPSRCSSRVRPHPWDSPTTGSHRTTTEVRHATAAVDVGMRDYCRLQFGGGGGGVGGGGGGRRGAMTAIVAVFGGRMPVRLVDAGARHDAPFGCLEVCRLTIITHRAVGAYRSSDCRVTTSRTANRIIIFVTILGTLISCHCIRSSEGPF